MAREILDRLAVISEEEAQILSGRTTIQRERYMQGGENTVNARKLLDAGKLIDYRLHTRFIPFPSHTHDYVEVIYMCEGETIHTVNGTEITLRQGELLFLNQYALHAVARASERDIAVNFIVLPSFFGEALAALGEEETPLRRFLVDALCGQTDGPNHLHFRVSQVVPVQNLVENLLFALIEETPSRRSSTQMIMTLLFLQLMGLTNCLETEDRTQATMVQVLSYIEQHYASGSLSDAAQLLHYDFYWLSREIKRKTGKTYTQLVQDKRLAQACFLLRTTSRNVDEIAHAVGYENMGYFHRIFRASFGMSPREYRVQIR
ncbi:MAG: helix-turn-helix domain-containing protein [Oscillospiraceae bacterium]|nr:helix-turn-helix domain-containing protein [Oscillospiraceae bacterium]